MTKEQLGKLKEYIECKCREIVASDKRVYVYDDETHSFYPLQFVELEESNKIT